MRRQWAATVAVMLGVACLPCLPCGAATRRKVYVDRANGITFTYPAGWVLNGDDDAATAKLRIVSVAQPGAVVQLEGNFAGEGPYKGTDFEAGAFAYVVSPGGTEAACFAMLEQGMDKGQRPVPVLWNGLRAQRLEVAFSIAGTQDSHRLIATYRNRGCYLFESVIVSHSPDESDKPLAPVRWRQIRAAFDGVMESVRIGIR